MKNINLYKEKNKYLIDAVISEFIKSTTFESGNIKNEFKIISEKEKEYTCISWGKTNIKEGDKVKLKIWKLPDVLLVDSIIITQKGETS